MRDSRRLKQTAFWTGSYVTAYILASFLDLWTTELALARPGNWEANIYVKDGEAYIASRAWTFTAIAAFFLVPLFAFGTFNARKVARRWLEKPIQSFRRMYFNPFSWTFVDRSPLHAICWSTAFVVLRLLASVNNAMIAAGMFGPIGSVIRFVARLTTPEFGFIAVVGPLYIFLGVAVSPLAARFVEHLQHELGEKAG